MAFLTRRAPDAPRLRLVNPGDSRRAKTLLASGEKVQRRDVDTYRRLVQPWQQRAFAYYDALGEVKYASQFYSRMLGGLRLYPGLLDENGQIGEDPDPKAKAALDRIQDPGGGRTGLLGAYGRLMFLIGECIMFVSNDPDTGLEQWEILSPDELRLMGSTYLRLRAPSLSMEEYRAPEAPDDEEGAWVPVAEKGDPSFIGEAVAYRLWQRHPRYSMLADSTMMGILNICEELLLLEQSMRSQLRSRIAGNGILIIDDRVTAAGGGGDDQEQQPDEDPAEDAVLDRIIDGMLTPIRDEGTASAVVPLLLRADPGDGSKIQDLIYWLQIGSQDALYQTTGLRLECVRRMAIGLDMPPEVLEGMGDVNHWSAWSIDEQTWKQHGQPKAQQLVDDLTSAYYRPYLRDVDGVEDWDRRVIAYDPAAVINHPDRSKDAKDLYDRVAIGKAALREATGFTDDDEPTEEERAERIGIATRDSSLAWDGIPSVKAGGIEPKPGEIVSGQSGGSEAGTPTGPSTGSEVEPGPPPGGPENAAGSEGNYANQIRIGRLLGGADTGFLRAREAAGARLRSLLNKDPELRDEMRNVPKTDLAAVLGRERVRKLGVQSDKELVRDARDLIVQTLAIFKACSREEANHIADAVEMHAIRTLYDIEPRPLPDTLADYLRKHMGTNGSS